MIYKEFQEKKLSALGMGGMRFPCIDGSDGVVDKQETARLIDLAIKGGINYFDTAWGYHNQTSETVLGEILEKYPRESFYLADKFPGYDLSCFEKKEEIFDEQLKKCRVDYFDFYLFHNVCEMNIDMYTDPKNDMRGFMKKRQEEGKIRHLGFSIHGDMEVMRRFMDTFGDMVEFCQIQLNYIDWDFQDARDKVAYLRERNIPIWVMEPVRGGKLVSLGEANDKILKAMRPEATIASWAFRYLQQFPDVTVTLSGMSNEEQLVDNLKTYTEENPLTKEELDTLLSVGNGILDHVLGCTACNYCVSYCPQGLNIPKLIKLYNEHHFTGGGFIAPMVLETIDREKWPNACIGCKSCEEVCPQKLPIAHAMSDFVEKLKD